MSSGSKPTWFLKQGWMGFLRGSVNPRVGWCLVGRQVLSWACWMMMGYWSVWGRDLKWVSSLCFGDISLTLILVPSFIQQKYKRWKHARTLLVVYTKESKLYWIKDQTSFLLLFYSLILFYFLFYFLIFIFILFFYSWQAKHDGSSTRWIHEEKMHEVCGLLTSKNSPRFEQKCKR